MSTKALPDSGTSQTQDPQAMLTDGSDPSSNANAATDRSKGHSSSPSLNPRSCITCRKRKVRCDKKNPCNNCARAGIECQFPGPGRAPRKPRKGQDSELLARLRRLEGVVQTLGAQVDDQGAQTAPGRNDSSQAAAAPESGSVFSNADPKLRPERKLTQELGRLVVDEGRSRYVINSIWTNLAEEVAEMKDLLDSDEESEGDHDSPVADFQGSGSGSGSGSAVAPGSSISNHHSFVFGYSSTISSLRNLHPTPTQVFVLYRIYKENVDPIVKIFHRPTLSKILMGATTSVDGISKVHDAVLFSVYYAAVTSLTPAQCQNLLGEERDHLLNKFRFATEQAQARAGFLNTSNIELLQAFVLFLLCVRRHDNTRFVWTLCGIALRVAVSLGVHRDGTRFNLPPFETEMRRRLWWHICILDTRSAEDQGTDPSIFDANYDTHLPLNVNDEDLYAEMTEFPEEQVGCTEMTFCLIRFEVTVTFRRLTYVPPGTGVCSNIEVSTTLEAKEQLAEALQKRLEERYLQHCDMAVPIFWVSATIARLILAKMWLVIHHPLQRDDRGKLMTEKTKDRLFETSMQVIEFSKLLETNENTARWGWLFHTYTQWHAVVFLLSELITRPPGPMVDRAWNAVDSVYDGWTSTSSNQRKGMLWKPMRLLMGKAIQIRQQQLQSSANRWGSRRHGDLGQESTPSQVASNHTLSDQRPAFMEDHSVDTLGQAAQTFGIDLDTRAMYNNPAINFDFNTPIQPSAREKTPAQEMTPAQRNLSDEDIDQWIATDQLTTQQPPSGNEPDWTGWDAIMTNFQHGNGDGMVSAITGMTDWI